MTSPANRLVALAAEIANIDPERRLPANSNGRYSLISAAQDLAPTESSVPTAVIRRVSQRTFRNV